MSSSWQRARLGDFVTHQKGFAFKASTYGSSGHPIVRVSDFSDDSIDLSSCVYVDDNLAGQYEAYRLQQLDVVIATVGSWPTNPKSVVGKTIAVPASATGALLNQNAVRLRSRGGLHQRFLYYLLKDAAFGAYIINTAQGSANQASITLNDIFGFEFALPALEEQVAIAGVLGSLDDKIEQNRRTGRALEGLARATFKAWFVDFEPVKAKAAGQTSFPGMSAATIAVLPNSLTDTQSGPVPTGWRVGTVADLGVRVLDRVSSDESVADDPLLDLSRFPSRSLMVTATGAANELTTSRIRFGAWDTLFGLIRPYFHKVLLAPFDGVTNTSVAVVRSRERADRPIMTLLLSSEELVAHATRLAQGTKMPVARWADISAYPFALPDRPIRQAFNQVVSPLLEPLLSLPVEQAMLAKMRDYLLPCLLSGRVRVRDAERAAERLS